MAGHGKPKASASADEIGSARLRGGRGGADSTTSLKSRHRLAGRLALPNQAFQQMLSTFATTSVGRGSWRISSFGL
jgi:hypothetical protein